MKASITIEGAIIYPIMIISSVLLILYGFYTHDRLSAKSATYTYLLKNYHDADSTVDTSDLPDELEQVCLLRDTFSISYNPDTLTARLNYPTGNIVVSFTNYERCIHIRTYYTLLQQRN